MSLELTLPPSMSSMFIVEPLVLNKKADGPLIYYGEYIRTAALVYLGYTIQGFMIKTIWDMDTHNVDVSIKESTLLEFVCIFIFEIAMFVEVRNACDIIHLLYVAPTAALGIEALVGEAKEDFGSLRAENARGAVMTEEGREGWLGSQMRRVRGKTRDVRTADWSLKGMTSCYKIYAIMFIAVPKLMIGVCLAIVGGLWIPRSPTPEDLILNTLAMNFIVDIDPLMYGAFSSDAQRDDLDHMQPIEHFISNAARKCLWGMNAFVYPLAVVGVSLFTIYYSRHMDDDGFWLSLRGGTGAT